MNPHIYTMMIGCTSLTAAEQSRCGIGARLARAIIFMSGMMTDRNTRHRRHHHAWCKRANALTLGLQASNARADAFVRRKKTTTERVLPISCPRGPNDHVAVSRQPWCKHLNPAIQALAQIKQPLATGTFPAHQRICPSRMVDLMNVKKRVEPCPLTAARPKRRDYNRNICGGLTTSRRKDYSAAVIGGHAAIDAARAGYEPAKKVHAAGDLRQVRPAHALAQNPGHRT